MPPAARLISILVAAIVVVAVVLLVVRGTDPVGQAGASPTGSAPASASPAPSVDEEPSEPPSTPTGDDAAVLAEIEEAVEQLRGLPPAGIGPPEVIDRDALRDELVALIEAEYPEEERRADNITLRAMGLLEPDQDLAELQLELLGDQVLGFYDDVDKRMVVVSEAGVNAQAKFTYAHEYTHALQDAAFGLDALGLDERGDDDRVLARTALVEGDASLAMFAWAADGGLSQEELTELFTIEVPDTSGIPSWLVAITAEFPYIAGLEWATALTGRNPLAPDFAALDDAYATPPDSTEQIMHLEKWESREAPVEVEAPDLAGSLGDGWEEVETTTIGEAWIGINLEFFGLDERTAGTAAEGWGGDRLVVASGPDDEFALAWILAWDTPTDADEFVAAYGEAIDTLAFPAEIVELDDERVLVAHASAEDLLVATIEAAGG